MTYPVRLFLSVLLAAPLAASASASATAETRPSYPYKLIVLGAGSGSYAAAINKAGKMTGVIPGVSDHVFIYTGGVLNDIGTLPGFQSSVGVGINNAGEVVGGALGQGQISHGFVYSGGTFRDIGTLGGGMTGALDINDVGDIVGSSVLQEHFPFAFLYRNGVMRNLGCLPGSDRSNAQAINDKGVIAGSSGVGPAQGPNGNQSHAVIWKHGNIKDLGTLGGLNSYGVDINDRGQVTGYSTLAGDTTHGADFGGFIWKNGTMRNIGAPPGGSQVQPFALNNHGQVVGFYSRQGQQRAFLYGSRGKMRDLSDLVDPAQEWRIVVAHDINDAGQISGQACDLSGFCTAVRLDPSSSQSKLDVDADEQGEDEE